MKWSLARLETTAGYLKDCPVVFTPGLNCIIGARGTCKSTIIETIRFVFDCDPSRVTTMLTPAGSSDRANSLRAGLIAETLAGGTARCTLTPSLVPGDSAYVVERNTQNPPRVFRDGVQQIDDPGLLHRVEIYSQGDLHGIAEQAERRLSLIDRPNQARVSELRQQVAELTAQLRDIGLAIRQRRPEIETRVVTCRGLDDARRQLGEIEKARPALSPELESERAAYEVRRQAYERLKVALQARERLLTAARTALSEEQALREASDFAHRLDSASAKRIAAALAEDVANLSGIKKIVAASVDLQAELQKVVADFEQASAKYYELRKGQQQANESLKQEEALRQALSSMERVAGELATLQADQARSFAQRTDLRARRDAAVEELYALRLRQVEAINSEYGDHIVLTLQQGALTEGHRHLIEELLQRSNLRNQGDVARELAERVRPSDLVDLVEAGDAKCLADILGRDIGQMTRLVGHLVDNARLYDLETVVPDDSLEITMVVRGESRPLSQLSKGQMATALLPLILREADYPLIVDQPEDDLDNAFVSERLIKRIRRLAETRQLIFVTHNANIPVLGNAEQVVVMEMDGPRRAVPCRVGSIDDRKDDIIKILEGGRQAFRSRQDRYGAAVE